MDLLLIQLIKKIPLKKSHFLNYLDKRYHTAICPNNLLFLHIPDKYEI